MKGERILAELLSLAGMVLYVVAWQHLMAEMLHEPDRSWFNQARLWWVTRHSQAKIVQLNKNIWGRSDAPQEPTGPTSRED